MPVTGLDILAPRIDDCWIERVRPQAWMWENIAANKPLLEVVGAGGFGKSWLAAWVYHQAQRDGRTLGKDCDRALWVNVRKAPSFNQVARWVLQEIGFLLDEPHIPHVTLRNE